MLANFYESLRISYGAILNNQFAEFLVNSLRMLRILANAHANFATACERLTNETTAQRETPCQCFAVSLLFAMAILNIIKIETDLLYS